MWFLAALRLPSDVATGVRLDPRTMTPVAATMHADGQWADVTLAAEDGRRVVRGSSPDLWATVEEAYELWREIGRPGWESFGLTVNTSGKQRVWFDKPTQHIHMADLMTGAGT